METLVSQEQNLVLTKLEIQDLHKELSVCQEHVVTLRISLEALQQTLRDKEEVVQELQEDLKDQSAQLQEALEKNTMMEAELETMTNQRFHVEAEVAGERAKSEEILQGLKKQLGTFEKEVARLQKERQQLQFMLQQALEEKEALTKQVESTIATLEGRTQEAAQLRSHLKELTSNSQTLQKMFQETQTEVSDLRQECIHLKNHVEQLELEKIQIICTAEKLSGELEQCWGWLTEDSVMQKTVTPSFTVLDVALGTRSDAGSRATERNITGENNHGVAGLAEKEVIQTLVLQNLENADEKGGNAKQRTEANGKVGTCCSMLAPDS